MNLTSYISVFVLGFAGSLHCVGMCGPLQSFMFKTKWVLKVAYQYGRYIAYACIGILFYLMGFTSQLLSYQKYFTIFTGGIIIISVFIPLFSGAVSFHKLTQKIFASAQNHHAYIKFFLMGFANGLLPCGLVYVAASQSLLAFDLIHTLLLMLLFLLGTLPALLGINYIYGFLHSQKIYVDKLKPIMMLAIGLLLIYRGVYSTKHHAHSSTEEMCIVK